MRSGRTRRGAFTLVELFVVMAILGVMVGLLIPAVMRVRDAGNRAACKNNLRQVGIALANYESALGRLPPGGSFRSAHGGEFGATWMARVLPYLEGDNAYRQIHYLKPTALNAPVPLVQANAATASVLKVLQCPSDGLGGTTSQAAGGSWAHSNYLGFVGIHNYGVEHQEGAFGSETGRTMAEFQDGTSNTVVVGEYLTGVPQAEAPYDLRGVLWLDRPGSSQLYARMPPNSVRADVLHINSCYSAPERNLPCDAANEDDLDTATSRSRHRGGVNALLGDGSVRWVTNDIELKTWRSLVTVSTRHTYSEEVDLGVTLSARRAPGAARAKPEPITLRDRYIVSLSGSGVSGSQLAALKRSGVQVLGNIKTSKTAALSLRIPPDQMAKVMAMPGVKGVMRDRLKFLAGQVVPTGVRRINADKSSDHAGHGGSPVNATIAIMDSGIDRGHPDLNVVASVGFGFPNGQDSNGHGTHVAGTAAAIDNDIGVVGVAPGARLWALRIADASGALTLGDEFAAIAFLIDNAGLVDVVNMSFGGAGAITLEAQLIEQLISAGVIVVAAAGNDASDVDADTTLGGGLPFTPADYGGVIAVGALADSDGRPGGLGPPLFVPGAGDPITFLLTQLPAQPDDTFALFSNFGNKVAVVAPGVNILSTFPGGKYGLDSGTSMASPHVTGLVALVIANNPRHLFTDQSRIRNVHIALQPVADRNDIARRINRGATEQMPGPASDFERQGQFPYSQLYPVANAGGF